MAITFKTPLKATRLEIKAPEFIPTPDPLPPVPHTVPHMSTTPAPVAAAPQAWRVRETDIPEIVPWLFPRLQERWPRVDADRLIFWMRASPRDNNLLVCRSRGAVGAFMASMSILEPWPTVNEVFVRSNTRETIDWLEVYAFAWRWAASISARECRFGLDTDAKLGEMRKEGADFGVDLGRQRAFFVSPVKE